MAYTYKGKKPVLENPGAAPIAPVIDPYKSIYSDEIKGLADKVANRDPFSYNQNKDPAFQAYAEQYLNLGNRAMTDTLGQVAANTGGVASSYAVSAAGQAKSQYNQQLMGVIPELMNAAYNRYQGEFSMDNQALGSLQGVEDSNFNKYTDNRDFTWGKYETKLGQFNNDRSYGLDKYGQQLGQYNSDRDFGFNSYTDSRDFAYQKSQDAIDNALKQAANARAAAAAGRAAAKAKEPDPASTDAINAYVSQVQEYINTTGQAGQGRTSGIIDGAVQMINQMYQDGKITSDQQYKIMTKLGGYFKTLAEERYK